MHLSFITNLRVLLYSRRESKFIFIGNILYVRQNLYLYLYGKVIALYHSIHFLFPSSRALYFIYSYVSFYSTFYSKFRSIPARNVPRWNLILRDGEMHRAIRFYSLPPLLPSRNLILKSQTPSIHLFPLLQFHSARRARWKSSKVVGTRVVQPPQNTQPCPFSLRKWAPGDSYGLPVFSSQKRFGPSAACWYRDSHLIARHISLGIAPDETTCTEM